MPRRTPPWWALCLVPAIAACLIHQPYALLVIGTVGIDALAAIGLALTLQKAGQPSLAQTTFMAIGAYTAALLELSAHWPLVFAGLAGVAAATVCSWIVGAILLNLEGLYFALGTLALNAAAVAIFQNSGVFGNDAGLENLATLQLPGISAEQAPAVITWALIAAGLVIAQKIDLGRLGRGLRMLRESSKVAQSAGFDPAALKRFAFTVSGAYAGLAGVLLVSQLGIVNPSLFSTANGIALVAMVIAGGEALVATIGGALVIVLVHEVTRSALQYAPVTLIGGTDLIANGLVLVVILRLWPGGITSLVEQLLPRRRTVAAADRVPAPPHRLAARTGQTVLEAHGIGHRFGGVFAVHGVALRVASGEILAVIGPNGAGKTTLLNVLGGYLPIQDGDVLIDGRSIAHLAPFQRARAGVAATFQHMEVVQRMSVVENVLAGGTRMESVAPALAAVDLLAAADTHVSALSFGQQRMVELARVLASDAVPRVLLMDEPASGLSQAERSVLAALVRRFAAAGSAVVLVEHDVAFVSRLADRILVLDHGEPLAEGEPEALLRTPAVIDAYLGTPLVRR
jgi:branched-chain amino acid transport system permease protein